VFNLVSKYKPSGDQPQAIEELVNGIKEGKKHQVLLGATGTGKTFTIANIIKEVNKPTLILAHNKTLAGQLYSEFKELFPNNRVEYFVSYYDYYQPEAYVPSTDTYIEKDSSINDEIDELRHAATSALLSEENVIVVASVSCIYGIGEVEEYKNKMLTLSVGDTIDRNEMLVKLVEMLYERNDFDFKRGTFRVRGDVVEIIPANQNTIGYRIEFFDNEIDRISEVDTLTGVITNNLKNISIFPASHFVVSDEKLQAALVRIKNELEEKDRDVDLTIAVSHYPLNWLNAEEEKLCNDYFLSEAFLNVDILMCGHVHDFSVVNYFNHTHSLLTLVTGIGWDVDNPNEERNKNHRYSLYTLNLLFEIYKTLI